MKPHHMRLALPDPTNIVNNVQVACINPIAIDAATTRAAISINLDHCIRFQNLLHYRPRIPAPA